MPNATRSTRAKGATATSKPKPPKAAGKTTGDGDDRLEVVEAMADRIEAKLARVAEGGAGRQSQNNATGLNELREEALPQIREALDLGQRLIAVLDSWERLSYAASDLANDPKARERAETVYDESGVDGLNRLMLAIAEEIGHRTGSEANVRFADVSDSVLARFPELRTATPEQQTVEERLAALEADLGELRRVNGHLFGVLRLFGGFIEREAADWLTTVS